MAFFSIVVPVYNVSKYLEQCVNSLLDQELADTEIILVDDGSTDNSGEICDLFAKRYPCIKVVHKENGGLSSARNTGINYATGDYVSFVDSDDWWNTEVSVANILKRVKARPDVEMFQYSSLDYYEGQGTFKRKEHDNLMRIRTDSVEHYYQDLLQNGNLEVSAATKIIKRSFLVENNLTFKEGILSEDNEWILRLLRVLTVVVVIDEPLYICRMRRQGSISNTIGRKNITDLLWIIESSINYYEQNESPLRTLELNYCSYLWFSALGLSCQLKANDFDDIRDEFNKCSSVCEYSNSPKTRVAYCTYQIFGLSVTRRLLGVYIQRKQHNITNRKKCNIV